MTNEEEPKPVFLLIAGCRWFTDSVLFEQKVDFFLKRIKETITIISGGCRGADQLAVDYANYYGIPLITIRADWSQGNSAGPTRNSSMVRLATHAILFWDGNSRGTKDTLIKIRKKKIPYRVVYIKKEISRFRKLR